MKPKECRNCGQKFVTEEDYLTRSTRWRVCEAGNLWFNCLCESTLVLTPDRYKNAVWFHQKKIMSDEAESVFQKISKIHSLPHIPTVIMELQQKLEDPDISSHELALTVRQEPFISAQVLSIFNNMRLFRGGGTGDSVDTNLEYAISYIGRKQLASLTMLAYFEKIKVRTNHFEIKSFWEKARLTAGISEWLCSSLSYENKDKAYLAGYLCNIGKLVGAIVYPKETDKIWTHCGNPQTQGTWSELEKQEKLPDHSILGEIALAFWGLPTFLMGPVRFHHKPEKNLNIQSESDLTLTHLVAFANILAHWISLEPHLIKESELDAEKQYFGLTTDMVEKMSGDLGRLFRPIV